MHARSSTMRRLVTIALFTTLLALALLLGLKHLTAQAKPMPDVKPPDFDLIKTASHEDAAKGITLTFTIDVHSNKSETSTVNVIDTLPPEMEPPTLVYSDSYVTAVIQGQKISLTASDLPPGEGARLVYTTRIKPNAECGQKLVNKAQIVQNDDPIGDPVETQHIVICSDLGDAPDSDNHFSTPMHTPSGAVAHFPTVYNPPGGSPSGPLHHRADLMHLGEAVSFERQADFGPDTDMVNNILPPVDAADLDRFDDGLLNKGQLTFEDCQPETLILRVYMDSTIADTLDRAFVNVWFDSNRDGDWGDVHECPPPTGGNDTTPAPEHIVIDYPVSVQNGYQTITVTTHPVFNPTPDDPAWLRVTLSEQPSVKIGTAGPWHYGDGRGIFSTLINPGSGEEIAGFRLGETEDYLLQPPVEPRIEIVKTVAPTQTHFGGTLSYEIQVTNNSRSLTKTVSVVDPIPNGTTYISGTFFSSLPGWANGYDAAHDAVFWKGQIPPGQTLHVKFDVRVVRCEPTGFRVVNVAWARERGFPPLEAKTVTSVDDCAPPPRRIAVTKVASKQAFPSGDVQLTLVARNGMQDRPANLVVMDPLPLALSVNPAQLPPELDFIPPNVVVWQPQVEPGTPVSVTFSAHVRGWACRERGIPNQAHWWATNVNLDGHSNRTWTELICSDLGDAPDSTYNHHAITNTAYNLVGTVVISPLVRGRFPTVWQADYPPSEPSGPLHMDASKAWLGRGVSYEREADVGPDADGLNNILAFGKDNADNDRFDDGWLNPHVPLPDCKETTLQVRISRGHPAVERMWLNVWFDGNRDGDWEDVKFCSNDQRQAFEWIVQNFVVDMSNWPVGAHRNYLIRTRLILNDTPERKAWMRFTLSEAPAPRNPDTGLADGRGPDYKHAYRWGETEDYQAPGMQTGTPGQVRIDKTASTLTATLGQVYTYSVYLSHSDDGTAPAYAVMTDVLPAEVKLVGAPTVTETHLTAAPLVAHFNSHVGPSGAVGWHGWLSPGAAIRVDFPVRVRHCPPNDPPAINNRAAARQLGNTDVLSASVETRVDCTPPPKPDLTLSKRIVTDLNETLTDWTTVPGRPVAYQLVLSGTNNLTHTVHISDPMQSGVVAVAVHASSGIAHIRAEHGRQYVVWNGEVGPAIHKVTILIRVKLRDVHCGQVIKNQAYWSTRLHSGESNVAWLRLACHDLGDAPDSSNHDGVRMTAYPAVTATFPTVYTGTTPLLPVGPLHVRPWPLHLGPRVSFEIEADRGMDLDGVNNIRPQPDKANMDRADDGLEMATLQFTHCEYKRIPVWISIDPLAHAFFRRHDKPAYLNVWLDSLRDGDWDDVYECSIQGETVRAPEHIVIDEEIDVASLGVGLHRIYVTTGPVPWPDDKDGPAWLRVTLSERQANKTLPASCTTAPDCDYGDGRGYASRFMLGETEDYVVRGLGHPDPTVEKRGIIYPAYNFDAQKPVWHIGWRVAYKNAGGPDATDVRLIDTLSGDQHVVKIRSYPHLTPTIAGQAMTFTVGTLGAGQQGYVFIRTRLPYTTAPGTVLTNTVIITSPNDSGPANNRQVKTVTVPLLPPRITYPRAGVLCSGVFTITGRSYPGSVVELFINHTSVDTITTDAAGEWWYPVNLPDGTHKLQAGASYGGLTSPISPPVRVVVDSSLAWAPMSLRFTAENGHVVFPKDPDGRAGEYGWFVFLRPGTTYTATVYVCCDDPNAAVTLLLPDGRVIDLEDPDGDGWYEGAFTTPDERSGGPIRLCVVCYNVEYCVEGEVLIDPEGVVFDVTEGITDTLESADVACYEKQTDLEAGETAESTMSLWSAESYEQVNPQTTAADGYFSFFTPAGVYQLGVSKSGYQPYQSWDLVVVDEPVEFNVPLTPETGEEADVVVAISEAGFDPPVLTVAPGDIVEWINIGEEAHTSTSMTPTAHLEGMTVQALTPTDAWDSGLLASGESYQRQLNTVGSYTYYDHENAPYTGMIVVQGAQQIYLPLVLRNAGG